MLTSTIVLHMLLAIVLFFIINWIGEKSISIGYVEITIYSQSEDNPAFNFLIRVLSPQVFLIIISAILYAVKLHVFVQNIYNVTIYYVIFRFIFNILMGRILLVDWGKQIMYWVAIIICSFLLYENIIKYKQNLLPDFSTIANELWVIIMLFVYKLVDKLNFGTDKAPQRKEKYIRNKFLALKTRYGLLINSITDNQALDIIVFAILIHEDFNRPKIIRSIEYLVFYLGKNSERTLGIMQYRTNQYINDLESVERGTTKVLNKYKGLQASNEWASFENYYLKANEIIRDYNGGEDYTRHVSSLIHVIKEKFYRDLIAEF